MTTAADLNHLTARVKRGAALLDEKRPGWAAEIAPDRLAMRDCHRCILGQLYGHYDDGRDVLRIWSGCESGFNCSGYQEATLADLWRSEIASRTQAPAPGREGRKGE